MAWVSARGEGGRESPTDSPLTLVQATTSGGESRKCVSDLM